MVDKPLTKTIHHAINVTSTEAKLFAIRCGINQSICFNNISKIIVITNSIHTARRIFDPSSHSFQTMSAVILLDLHDFFQEAMTIPLNSGNVQVTSSGLFMIKSTKRPSPLILHHYFHARIHGI